MQSGYKEGIYDGRQSVFQKGFDIGFEQAFSNAYTIGRYQGQLKAVQQLPQDTIRSEPIEKCLENCDHDLLLNKPTRGHCQVCINNELIKKDIGDILAVQSKHSESVNAALAKKYNPVLEYLKEDV